MEVSYKRSRGLSHLILTEDAQAAGPHYQKTIFLENTIPGLLSCKLQKLNGEDLFYYDITGCQSLKNLYEKEKLTRKDLEELLQSWLNLWEILSEYLLDTDFLLLAPSYLYRETQSGNYLFVWFPYRIGDKGGNFQTLTEYFLPRIDHKDKGAVSLGYGIYKEAAAENVHPAVIKRLLWEADPAENPGSVRPHEDCSDFSDIADPQKEQQEKERQKLLDEFYSEEEESPVSYGIWGGAAGVFLLCILVFLFWHFRLFSLFQLIIFLIILLFFTGLGGLLYIFLIREKKKSSPASHEKKPLFSDPENDFFISPSSVPFPTKPEKSEKKDLSTPEALTVLLKEPDFSVPRLIGLGKNTGKDFPLDKEQTLIGKWAASADICLDAPTVSRIHARILREGDKYYAVDLNSKNGTLINGIPLDPEEKFLLKNNDILSFAEEEFRCTLPSPDPQSSD